ncbi:tRNA (guanosine(46)-N7)-methyltransferase TrmB [Virgibacillus sp. DJP39]|uniref:tRNA (guanosine(46)-N7)-methyltransferase TrmB n=1 Tax=Virgibacillus sp. DJP39 TaxID=3409790 RepID=UPI003BB7E596
MRQRNKPWADDFLQEHRELVIANPKENKGKWQELFGNDNPIHLEIGTGKGQFIVGMAEQYPSINFIGIEMAKSIIVDAAIKIKESELKNLVLINVNANELEELFAENEISTIYLNFSDPWPKSRHEKRRLSYHTFLTKYEKLLPENSNLVMKTDNRLLFEYSLVSFSKHGLQLEEVSLDLHQLDDPTNVKTEYEEKFSSKGQPIYRCHVKINLTH